MTLRCPKCGSTRLVYLSTTDGFAVGATDQKYKCKDCGYFGSLVVEDAEAETRNDSDAWYEERSDVLVMIIVLIVIAALLGVTNYLLVAVVMLAVLAVFVIRRLFSPQDEDDNKEIMADLKKIGQEGGAGWELKPGIGMSVLGGLLLSTFLFGFMIWYSFIIVFDFAGLEVGAIAMDAIALLSFIAPAALFAYLIYVRKGKR